MPDVIQQIELLGIIPVVKIDRATDAIPLGRALLDGGLPCAEITFRTSAAEEVIRTLTTQFPEMLIGAGTVLTVEQAERAIAAGAKFIVSPGFNEPVVDYCLANGVPIMPGVCTPTDVQAALAKGLTVLKFFPAETAGGLPMLKAISAPFGHVRFIPTGGINAANLNEYLAFGKVIACGGSWMVKDELISSGNFAEITRLTREAVQTMLGFSLRHVGINARDPEEARTLAGYLAKMVGWPVKDGERSIFVGQAFEVMKGITLGERGHIAIGTKHLRRAMAYLERQGFKFNPETAEKKGGELVGIYLEGEFGGYAIQLEQA